MKLVPWHDALLAIEHSDVVLLLTQENPQSKLLAQRMHSLSRLYSERGYRLLHVKVDEDCAVHPELAAVRLPQVRVFKSGEMVEKLVGLQDEDTLQEILR